GPVKVTEKIAADVIDTSAVQPDGMRRGTKTGSAPLTARSAAATSSGRTRAVNVVGVESVDRGAPEPLTRLVGV
ncbi:MAG: hypothetical protein QOI47_1837, partial [Actinomycetota bacterium]|nr:hypothetical protein [Actinomycetota bacterium]